MTDYVNESARQHGVEREMLVRSLMELARIDRAEASARADRFEDPRFRKTLVEVMAGLSPETIITNVEEQGDTFVVTVAARATGVAAGYVTVPDPMLRFTAPKKAKAEEQALKYATDSMRASVARIEVAKVFRRRSLKTALHLLIARGYFVPTIFWPALNPFRDEELRRRRIAAAAELARAEAT